MPESYQNFVPPHPRFPLATFPSPLERAWRLEVALREEGCVAVPRIYLKRDDLLSLGMGGNKIRNLEFSIGQALAEGATDVFTAGRPQSNHCRLTAAACARASLRAHIVLTGEPPSRMTGNLLLDEMVGAKLYWTGSDDRALRDTWVRSLAGTFTSLGRRAYTIPVGGSDARGALGHALAALELARQCEAIGEMPSAVVLATATGGTHAGMLVGFRKLDVPIAILGFAVAKSASELRDTVSRIAAEVAREIDAPPLAIDSVDIDDTMLGEGYGIASAAGDAAALMLARTEGVFADPVYTGKGLAGFLAAVRAGRFADAESVVFLHTGGTPALFADPHQPTT